MQVSWYPASPHQEVVAEDVPVGAVDGVDGVLRAEAREHADDLVDEREERHDAAFEALNMAAGT